MKGCHSTQRLRNCQFVCIKAFNNLIYINIELCLRSCRLDNKIILMHVTSLIQQVSRLYAYNNNNNNNNKNNNNNYIPTTNNSNLLSFQCKMHDDNP
jgi:hypothetical protein